MNCNGCGNDRAYRVRVGAGWEFCDMCGDIGTVGVADVFWDGTPEHGLPDDPRTGQPMVFGSKAEKARYLREHGLVEAGDKMHGSHATILRQNQEAPARREEVEAALHYVKQMGADRRRQEFNRILKENQARISGRH